MTRQLSEGLFDRLGQLCPEGYSIGFHFRFSRPAFTQITYREDWVCEYSKSNFIVADPAMTWGMVNTGSCRWSAIRTDDPLGVFAAASTHGYQFGLALGYGPRDSRTLGSCARGDREFTGDEADEIFDIVGQIHDVMGHTWQLKPHQKAALELFAQDRTYDEICQALRISRTALKNRMNGARTALGAQTNAEAVRFAIERGVIGMKSYAGISTGLPVQG